MARGKGIYKRGNVWWIRYMDASRVMRFESSESTKFADAETKLMQKRQDIKDGKDTEQVKDIGKRTFSTLAEEYLLKMEHQKGIRSKKGFVKALVACFGNLPLGHISTRLIEQYRTDRLTAGNKEATVNRHMATLKHMIQKAVDWEWASEDTLTKARKVKQFREEGRLRFLTEEESATLIKTCGEDHRGKPRRDLHLQRIVVTALNSGMRLEEILSLEWDTNINLKNRFILLEKTKSGRRRQIPISKELRETLQGLRNRLDVPFVFHTPMCAQRPEKGGLRYKDIGKSFDAAVMRAGLVDFHFHDLRHTFASRFIMAGGSVTTLKEILGHKSLAMTMRYAHLSPEHTAASVSIIDKMYVPAEEEKGAQALQSPANYTITIQSSEQMGAIAN